jgi:predicted RecB family nuclease
MKTIEGRPVFSPSDLNIYLASPFASWMDRFELEFPGTFQQDEATDDQKLIMETGTRHETEVLHELQNSRRVVEIPRGSFAGAIDQTLDAIARREPIIYQAALRDGSFEGYADFLLLDDAGNYEVWDTKLARSPKPYYAIQLCCYSEMLAATAGGPLPQRFGIILGTKERVEFRIEDFVHYYRHVRCDFLAMQRAFTGDLNDRPEPLARGNHYQWSSLVDAYLNERDHMVRVAGITVGQMKKLTAAGIDTLVKLSTSAGVSVPKLAADTHEKLADQAKLQCETRTAREADPEAKAAIRVLNPETRMEHLGLSALSEPNAGDVFFDMEGYPLMPGGLEYLFGACYFEQGELKFADWWAHDRAEEKLAFEAFIDWVCDRWRNNRGMHVYHYASYEKTALRRLSTFHNTRQDEVDDLLRAEVLVDLYPVVRQGLRIGEESYSIKKVELQYRDKRGGDVASAIESVVQYARWTESGEPGDWRKSQILTDIRDYNRDDCESTAQLRDWLIKLADANGLPRCRSTKATKSSQPYEEKEVPADAAARLAIADKLKQRAVEEDDPVANILADIMDFHRREEKPLWWRFFDRRDASEEELHDDNGCVEGAERIGEPVPEKRSLRQGYRFDPEQECKLSGGKNSEVSFTHNSDPKFNLFAIDRSAGTLELKASQKLLDDCFDGEFPADGSLIPHEVVPAKSAQKSLADLGQRCLARRLPIVTKVLLERAARIKLLDSEKTTDAAVRLANEMRGSCLIIQGPPGTGKTYTAGRMINDLVARGLTVGVTSNGHKVIDNLLKECGEQARASGRRLVGVKVGPNIDDELQADNTDIVFVGKNADARKNYAGGVIGGTAWLFTLDEWEGGLDYLFIDEAGQVSLANAVAMSRCAKNLVLLGDQMQLEQPIQGSHPGDSGMSVLQYALKDTAASKPDLPVFHAVVPQNHGLFLGESRRMHPEVCTFISDSIYDGRLSAHMDCSNQKLELPPAGGTLVTKECGIVFSPIEHDGSTQRSDEEVERVVDIYHELLGRQFTASDGAKKPIILGDFLFISPYNAQVRALEAALPDGARVGSVDKFQGQQAPVCILSLCSSCGEYGSRGLKFILDRNRINVAISRAKCLAIVIGDPRIAGDTATSLEAMQLLNLFCKIVA